MKSKWHSQQIQVSVRKTNFAVTQTLCERPTRLPPVFDSSSLLLVRAPQPCAPDTWCLWHFAPLGVQQMARCTLGEQGESVISEYQGPRNYRTWIRINGRAVECPLEYLDRRQHKTRTDLYERGLWWTTGFKWIFLNNLHDWRSFF